MLAKALASATAAAPRTYVEDVFSTWLYTGNGSTQTITNGIDLAGKGGLVWVKDRTNAGSNHFLFDTLRGQGIGLSSSNTNGNVGTAGQGVSSFNAAGFNVNNTYYGLSTSSTNYASWAFRKAAKFFDVVTYTGNGGDKTINHSLGSTPGMVIIKRLDSTSDWVVWHRSLTLANAAQGLKLNTTDAFGNQSGNVVWASTSPMTSTTFSVGASGAGDWNTNLSGATYVAYLFAHDAGGFGDSGNESVVKCGSYTGNGSTSGPTIDLGWEPQWLLVKNVTGAGNYWVLIDNMRGFSVTRNQWLYPNDSAAEGTTGLPVAPLATGLQPRNSGTFVNESGSTYIYIAIRRGPMKTPTDATKVFSAQAVNGSTAFTTNFPVDLAMFGIKVGSLDGFMTFDRQRGSLAYLKTTSTAAEATTTSTYETVFDNNTGSNYKWWSNTSALAGWNFRRAPGFFDVVAYGPGSGTTLTVNHNLGVLPELVIIKSRSSGGQWIIQNGSTNYGFFNTNAFNAGSYFTTLTNTAFSLTVDANTYIAYLFASCPGVSKVGSYTGTGTTQQINCGFTAGARFVLIKRTDSTGDWFVWDTARGIIAANDPYLLLNSTAAEVTNTDYIDPLNSGFEISSTAPAAINANGGSYIYLAIA